MAQAEQPLLRAHLRARIVPTRTSDGAQEHRVGLAARLERPDGQRLPRRVDRDAADRMLLEDELVPEQRRHRRQGRLPLANDLRTDAVPGKKNNDSFHAASVTISAYSMLSASACQEASMMLVNAPTVLQCRAPLPPSASTRVIAAVPSAPSRIRTL